MFKMSSHSNKESNLSHDDQFTDHAPPCLYFTNKEEGECPKSNECQFGIKIENVYSIEKKPNVRLLDDIVQSEVVLHADNMRLCVDDKTEDCRTSPPPIIISSIKLLQCDFCFQSYLDKNDFDMHQEICGSRLKSTMSCNDCRILFSSKEDLQEHLTCHENKNQLSCKTCGISFNDNKHLDSHLCSQKIKSLVCGVCGCEFSKLSSLKNHLKIHNYPPGREFVAPTFCETILSESSWSSEVPALPSLMPQLEITSNADISQWNETVNNSDQNKDFQGSLDLHHDIVADTSYSGILDGQSTFHNDFDSIVEVSEHSDLKSNIDLYFPMLKSTELKDNQNSALLSQNTNDSRKNSHKPHTCKHCGVSFTREKALISHERFHQDYLTDILECKKCGEIFLKKEELKTHITKCSRNTNKATIDVNFSENQNPKIFQKTPPKELHEFVAYENENLKYPLNEDIEPIDNPAVNVKASKHTCEHCFKRFTTKQKKFRHMWIHRNKTFSCEVCSETFATQLQLNEHRLTTHEGNTPHGCVICGKCFASRQGLWEHMRLHKEGSAPHQCNLCGKKFTSRQGYHIHVRTHTGERPYGCRYCWKAFRDGGTLRKHERIHTGERPHVCPICRRAFNQKVVLREHVRWLHAHPHSDQNQPFIPCPIPNCQQTLTDKEDLCAHIVKHSDTLSNVDASSSNYDLKVKTKPLKAVKKRPPPQLNDVVVGEDDPAGDQHKCEMCGEVYPARDLLLSHIKVHI